MRSSMRPLFLESTCGADQLKEFLTQSARIRPEGLKEMGLTLWDNVLSAFSGAQTSRSKLTLAGRPRRKQEPARVQTEEHTERNWIPKRAR